MHKSSRYLCSMLQETLFEAMHAGAKVLQQYFNGEFKVTNKEGINNLVTEADHESERVIFEVIRKQFPDHFILSEETGEIASVRFSLEVGQVTETVNVTDAVSLLNTENAQIQTSVTGPALQDIPVGRLRKSRRVGLAPGKNCPDGCLTRRGLRN